MKESMNTVENKNDSKGLFVALKDDYKDGNKKEG